MGNLQSILNSNSGAALGSENQTAGTLLASIGFAFASFGGQLLAFILLRMRLSRIYRPRSYLVPERQRVAIPPSGIIAWLKPVFATSGMSFIQKCGLDAYFFLRYLRTLLKIFVPAAMVILPILLPLNRFSGGGKEQLNVFNITNVAPRYTSHRLWAHLILAICFICWVCYVVYKELRGYIRVRQAFLTSPQHRIRASATTVLVTGIPKKWATLEALEGLYDVFPGGIRNIWINRNYDELSVKVERRTKYAKQLESAETNLIQLCLKKHLKDLKAQSKSENGKGHEMTPVGSEASGKDSGERRGHESAAPPSVSQEELLRKSVDTAETATASTKAEKKGNQEMSGSKIMESIQFWKKSGTEEKQQQQYDHPYHEDYDEDKDESATWRRFIEPKDRETIRLPIINQDWFPSIPLIGKKVDRIYYLRRELARLNMEIKTDQTNVNSFPLMNSAFIQFNHQVAAHMACQAVNHHVPLQMAPRLVEVSPNDVIWDNMSIKWWERYLRTLIVLAISVTLIIFYAVPVSFSAALGNLGNIGNTYPSLSFLSNLSPTAKSIIQGIGPPLVLQIILILVPLIYGFLVKLQGVPTGNDRELGVQNWYFAFLFIQVFLIASISTGLLSFFSGLASDPGSIAKTLAQTLPQAANYFFSYITVQALGNSAGALLQLVTLLMWFVLAPMLDSTPRDKWTRQTKLSNIQWGKFFPPFTNFAVIGIIYSVLAPLIIPFVILIFALFWVVYRYNVLYVYEFKHDTGGLLFPVALNQLFVGLYFMEVCLTGYFFLARDDDGYATTIPQAILMIVTIIFTVGYQWLLNDTFAPLFRYIPITLEDDAVERDEEFARVQASKWADEHAARTGNKDGSDKDIQEELESREKREEEADRVADEQEKEAIEQRRRSRTPAASPDTHGRDSWHNADASRTWKGDRWRKAGLVAMQPVQGVLKATDKVGEKVEQNFKNVNQVLDSRIKTVNQALDTRLMAANGLAVESGDTEAQQVVGDVLFSGIADELEDLTVEERDILVQIAFQHSALRARQPVMWIPQDDLGVSDDEILRAKKMSKWLPMSNVGTRLDVKGRVIFDKSPPDFSNVDLIQL